MTDVPVDFAGGLHRGQWSVVSGQWSVVSGQWSVVSGHWPVSAVRGNPVVSCHWLAPVARWQLAVVYACFSVTQRWGRDVMLKDNLLNLIVATLFPPTPWTVR